jgi:ABC-type phosphate transport system substrate-binding protein
MKTNIAMDLIFAAIVWMLLSFPGVAFTGDVVVIANKDVPVGSLSGDEVQNIFLAKKTQWDNGQKIEFVTLKEGDIHNAFLKAYINKTDSQFQRYFRTLVFTGKGTTPQTFQTEGDLVGYVTRTGGSIGYVSSGTNTGSAKVINVN